MRVGIIGGGPAGLYLATLLARADPTHEVTVVERNSPDATFGWGVVFSEETLAELRDVDHETFVALDDLLVRWQALDIRYRGQTIRSRGHGFSAISRVQLLGTLQERARSLGVRLRFEHEAAGPETFADRDLVVGADGIASTVRTRLQDAFGTSFQPHASRYAWFGTDLLFDVFTFIFEETPHGLFTVHGYPFDGGTSTFIVEVSRDTWQRAGLDRMSEEESLQFCQTLFADHLGGHKLMSNRSVWTRFVTVRNRTWHHRNVVLVGDAAHTAHFSIGSGTKLAMEDAIALARALTESPHDLEAAFTHYELDRQIPVERFQDAAADSARYFEHVGRHVGFAPDQFAFNLLTRSGRITRLGLELRDPAIVNRVDRWHQAHATGRALTAEPLVAAAPRHAPLTLAGVTLPNRVVLSLAATDVAQEGAPGRPHETSLLAAVTAGAGLVVTEPLAVSAHGRVTSGSAGLYHEAHVEAWHTILARLRSEGDTLVAARSGHAGRRGATRPRRLGLDRPLPPKEAWPLLAPSPLPYTPRAQVPRDLFERDDDVVGDFAAAAAHAAAAGFDLLVVDMSDGYLLASVLSPLTNRRDDLWGGPLDVRLRYPLRVLDAVRAVWPRERPLAVRLNVDDRHPDGLAPEDGVAIARILREHGCHLVDVVAGHTVADGATAPDYRRQFLVGLSDRVRNEAGVATVTSGAITTFDEVDTIVAAGRADLVVLDPGRHYLPDRTRRRP
ncbi:MAG TPA: FAD-dependent monooxygenase [Nitriliruptorales bacterium]|nr:FAD-dependent monooxygenase [Nitriliruptorales bacterium]